MSDENIFQFPAVQTDLPDQTIVLEKQPFRYCEHPKISLDSHQRLVNCIDCGAVLDPFAFLERNALVLQRAWSDHRSVKHSMSELSDRVTILKKEEARLKASIKRLKDKQPVIDTRGKEIL